MIGRLCVSALALFCLAAGAAEQTIDFSEFELGASPGGFRSYLGGGGQPGEWKIELDELTTLFEPVTPQGKGSYEQKVLAEVSKDDTDERFPILILEGEDFGDFTATVRVKMVAGDKERMAGLVFRFQDERNYYYIRASALGNSFYFFKVVNGIRSAPLGGKADIASEIWHDLTVECRGSRIRGLLNGQEIIPAFEDFSFSIGKIGFWTKSDSVSHFADLQLDYRPTVALAQSMVNETLRKFERLIELSIAAKPRNKTDLEIIASNLEDKIGQAGFKEAAHVIRTGTKYYGKSRKTVTVTLPLHDKNGIPVAAVRVVMDRFPGQTEKNAIVRALPIVRSMESRALSAEELLN